MVAVGLGVVSRSGRLLDEAIHQGVEVFLLLRREPVVSCLSNRLVRPESLEVLFLLCRLGVRR